MAFFLFDSNARIVADVLFGAGNVVKNRRFTAVRIAGQGNLDLCCIFHDYYVPPLLFYGDGNHRRFIHAQCQCTPFNFYLNGVSERGLFED